MIKSPHTWVQTSFFQVQPEEDHLTNPGVYGRELACWLAEKLESREEPVQRVFSEDWGWCVMLSRRSCTLWVGCSNRNGRTDEWGVFVAAEQNIYQRLVAHVDMKSAVTRVHEVLLEIMHEVPDAKRVWVEDD